LPLPGLDTFIELPNKTRPLFHSIESRPQPGTIGPKTHPRRNNEQKRTVRAKTCPPRSVASDANSIGWTPPCPGLEFAISKGGSAPRFFRHPA
jgi:hypothetical protein